MAKFKNLKTGNTLTVKNEEVAAMMRKNSKRYTEIKAKKSEKTDNEKAE